MTYEELKNRLTQVETALHGMGSKQNETLDSAYAAKKIQQLNVIKESLKKKISKILKEEETMFVSTKGGDTKAVKMDMKTAMDLKKDPAITGIDTAKGKSLKETDRLVKNKGVEFDKTATGAIAKLVGKSLAKSLKQAGDEVARMKAHRIDINSFDIEVIYKGEAGQDEFSFYIVNDELHIVDFSFDKKLVEVGVKPSGEAIVNVDVLTNELLKHFRSLSEGDKELDDPDQMQKDDEEDHGVGYDDEGRPLGEGEGDDHHYIKVKSHDYKKAMAILDQNVDPTYVKMDVVDDDGAGNTVIYFMFKHEAGFDDMYDDSENPDSEFYQEPDEDPQAFIYDVVMDLRANDIELADHSADMDEAVDNSDWAMKIRNINQHGRQMKQVDRLKQSTPTINPDYKKAIGTSPRVKAIIDKLEAKRAQVMRDMEQEAEPQGGPISDKYGDMLNKIDTALEKARGGKVVHYDDRQVDTSTNENAIDPAEYGDIGKAYLAGFKKQHTLSLDQLEQLGRKIVKQIYKGDFQAAKAKHLNESDGNLVTFGYDLDMIQQVVDHLKGKYKEGEDFELHIGRGDDLPNAVTLKNPALEKDYDLNDMLNAAQSDEDRYDAYTDGEDTDYAKRRREGDDYYEDPDYYKEELEKGQVKKIKKIVGQLKNSVKGHGDQAKYLGTLIKEDASRNLDEIFGAIGYRQGFDEFIEDNPGAVEVLMEWIGGIPEFRERISNEYSREEQENLGFYYGDDDEDEYNESSVKEGRGDLETITRVVEDMAAEDGTTVKEAAEEIIHVLRITYGLDAMDEDGNYSPAPREPRPEKERWDGEIEENLNPEVTNKVNQFIKAMAKRYGYEEQDAVYAIMAALKQGSFDGVKEGDGLWANINAKKKRGEKASHGNSKAFKAAKKAGKALAKTKESVLKEFTDNSFKGSELIDKVNSQSPDMFGKGVFADLLPKGVASENDAFEALKKHDKSGIKARMGQYAPMFVHVQYHNLEHEGEDYRMHQTQYYNSNFKDKDPDFNPRVSKITLFKITKKAADRRDKEESDNLGTILVKTGEYVQDLNALPGLGKRVSEVVNELDDNKSKDLVKKAIADINGAMFKFRHSNPLKMIAAKDKDLKVKLDAMHNAIFDLEIVLKDKNIAETSVVEQSCKVGDILTKDGKKGKVIKHSETQATVDFGNGDVYGIAHSRIKDGKILKEATRQDLGMSSSVTKRRAKAELKKPGNDGSKVYGLDKDGKRVHIKSINDVDNFKKFELDADINEAKGGQIMPGDYVKNQHGNIYQRVDGKVGKHDAYVRVTNGKPGKKKTGLHDSFKLTLVNKDELEEAAPGFKHDCAAKVVHETYGKGNCIPEKHTLVKEGKKYVVTHYDVLFENGKTVEDIPVSELDIKTTNEHWHKGYKKKKK